MGKANKYRTVVGTLLTVYRYVESRVGGRGMVYISGTREYIGAGIRACP